MTIPYDIARCMGEPQRQECNGCLRKLAPWREFYQTIIKPENESGKECDYLIKVESK